MGLPNFNIRSGTIFLLVSLGINWPQLTVNYMKIYREGFWFQKISGGRILIFGRNIYPCHMDWAKTVDFLLGQSDFEIAFLIKLESACCAGTV